MVELLQSSRSFKFSWVATRIRSTLRELRMDFGAQYTWSDEVVCDLDNEIYSSRIMSVWQGTETYVKVLTVECTPRSPSDRASYHQILDYQDHRNPSSRQIVPLWSEHFSSTLVQ
jgi:hypothetical protein